jgi:DNA-binding IclR family transcriptional regulator
VQTVDQTVQMLSAFTTHGQYLRVTDFMGHLGVHMSTASRLAATHEAHGVLERAPGDGYRPGRTRGAT